MRNHIHRRLILLILFSFSLSFGSDSIGQIRSKLSNLRIGLSTGFNSNLFRVAEQSDTSRVEDSNETLEGKLFWWIYWNRRVKSFVSTSGSYSYYLNNTFANEWEWKAKTKTSFSIKRRPTPFFPAVKLHITFIGEQINQIYTNRALGAENFRDLNENGDEQIGVGDLFDHISYIFGGGFEFKFGKSSSLSLAYDRENRNYTDIGDPLTQNFYSLDNIRNNIKASFVIEPLSAFKIKFNYDGQDRKYDHKLVRDINGNEISNTQRHYWTNKYGLNFYWNTKGLHAKIGTNRKLRKDRFEGYYNYEQKQINGNITLPVSRYFQLNLGLERTWKDYDHLEISGNILRNRYLTLEAGYDFLLHTNVVFHTSFIHDHEKSTFEKFTYHRNIIVARFEYIMD